MTPSVPIKRVGTPFQSPSWRFDAIRNPDKFGFRSLCSRKKDSANCLNRLIDKGLSYKVNTPYPELFKKVDSRYTGILNNIFKKYLKRNQQQRLAILKLDQYENFVSWNSAKIEQLNDEWLKRLIKHVFSIEFDSHIQAAIQFHISDENYQIKRFIGYQIFAGESDKDIAKKWKIPVKQVEAVRNIFFDFSYFPKDKVAQWAILVQLTNNGDIKQEEFSLYKRVFDLGKLGLKAQVCGYELTDDERGLVSDFLSKSALINTFNIHLSTKTYKDALIFNKVVQDLARLSLQKEEVRLKQQEIRLAELQFDKLKRDFSLNADTVVQTEDGLLLDAAIAELSLKDNEPKFKPFFELKSIN